MERTNFERLRVYRKAERLADSVWTVVADWPYFAKSTVGEQLVRACDSVPANIAEGTGRGTRKEKRHFLRIARGSLYEAKNWLRRAHQCDLQSEAQVNELKPLLEALAPMLNAYLHSLGQSSSRTSSAKNEDQRPKL